MCRVVHTVLEGPVEMGEGFGTAAEAHAFAEVVTTLFAVVAVIAHHAGLDGDTLANNNVFDAWAYSGDDAACFVAQHHGCLHGKVPVAAMEIVVDCNK